MKFCSTDHACNSLIRIGRAAAPAILQSSAAQGLCMLPAVTPALITRGWVIQT